MPNPILNIINLLNQKSRFYPLIRSSCLLYRKERPYDDHRTKQPKYFKIFRIFHKRSRFAGFASYKHEYDRSVRSHDLSEAWKSPQNSEIQGLTAENPSLISAQPCPARSILWGRFSKAAPMAHSLSSPVSPNCQCEV